MSTAGLLLLSFSIAAQNPTAQLDSLFSLLARENQVLGSVYILKEGKPFYQATISKGNTTISRQSPLYRIGSISKTFTATLVMQAVADGQLELEDKLAQWYPEISNAASIDVRMLLAHRSGIHNFTNDAAYSSIMESPQTKEQMLQRFALLEPDFSPDEKMEYSNTNYVLLSYILEDLYQKPIAQLLNEKICTQAKLDNTYFFTAEKRSEAEADSYYWTGSWTAATNTHPSIPLGAGGVVSHPEELCLFMRGLHQAEFISEEALEIMKGPSGTGLGLFRYPFYDKLAFGHNGGIDGFISHASYMPSEDLAIALCLNGSQYPMNDLLIDILSIYFQQEGYELPSFEKLELEEELLMSYTGTYKSANFPLDIKVFLEDKTLKAQASGQGAFPLTAKGDNVFEFKAAGITMTFNPEAGTMNFEQGGLKVPFKR